MPDLFLLLLNTSNSHHFWQLKMFSICKYQTTLSSVHMEPSCWSGRRSLAPLRKVPRPQAYVWSCHIIYVIQIKQPMFLPPDREKSGTGLPEGHIELSLHSALICCWDQPGQTQYVMVPAYRVLKNTGPIAYMSCNICFGICTIYLMQPRMLLLSVDVQSFPQKLDLLCRSSAQISLSNNQHRH